MDAEALRAATCIAETALFAPPPAAWSGMRLDPGEAEAIALAWQWRPPLTVLLDDAAARRFARQLGLRVLGSAGVLVEAKRYALVAEVAPILDRLTDSGLYLSEAVRAEILRAAGEQE